MTNPNRAEKEALVKAATCFSRDEALFPKETRVLCAVSGGADSVALLFFLLERRQSLGLSEVAAIHFNHRLRAAADSDEAFVRELCARHQIPLFVGAADVQAEAAARRKGLEETSRNLRYAFLAQTAVSSGFSRIATGHTADDNVETVLLCLTRGTGLQGLTGIPPQRPVQATSDGSASKTVTVVRPFLTVTRDDVEAFLAARQLPHIEDETNRDTAFSRNRIRWQTAPVLRSINPRLSDAIVGMTSVLRQEESYMALQAQEARNTLSVTAREPDGLIVSAESLSAFPPAIGARVCRLLYAEVAGQEHTTLALSHVDALLSLCAKGAPAAERRLPNGLLARRRYSDLIIGPAPAPAPTFKARSLRMEGETPIPEIGLSFFCRRDTVLSAPFPPGGALRIDAASLRGTLGLRPRQTGDRLSVQGAAGSRSLKRLMIDKRFPKRLRDSLPVLFDEEGVVAVPFFGVDKRCVGGKNGESSYIVSWRRLPKADVPELWEGYWPEKSAKRVFAVESK